MLKPVIFLAFANARLEGHALLRNLPLELNGIRGALRAGGGATGTGDDAPWDLVERTDVTLDDVLRVLTDCQGRIAVFHYGGHAGTDELALESPTGAHAPAYAHGIAALLGQQAIPLVFLNGCSTQGQVKHLLDAGVQAVVATAQSIDDAQATRFATDFYAALAAGASLRRAFDQAAAAARAALGDQARAAYRDVGAIDDAPRAVPDEWPWALHVPDGAAARADWSLGDAIGDPLFGLPALPPGDLPPEPFRGLLPFTAAEARIFFGRGTEIRALYDQIRNPAGAPILLLYGQSGAGKSSLLDAGLLPRLAASGTAVRYARRDATLGLAGTLRVALGITDAATSPGAAWRAITTGEGTPGAPVQGATPPAARPLVVVLDQIEEVYTRAPADGSGPHVHDEVAAFLDALDALFHDPGARPPGRLVLAFRKDWLAEVEARLRERGLPYDKVFLERMDARGVTQAVTGVACDATLCAHYHLTLVAPDDLGREIAADLLADLTSPVAPTLQVLMAKLWAEAGRGGPPTVRIDAGLYHQVRTQGLALGAFVDEQIAALRADFADAVDSGFVLDLLAFHTTALVTAQLRPWRDVVAAYGHYPRLAALADRCEALSLLVTVLAAADAADATAPASADTTAEVRAAVAGRSARALSHDTLAPLVRRRFAESDRPGQRARRILESRLSGSPADARELLDRADLRMVEAGVSGMRALTPDEVALVARSARARTADRWIRRGAIAAGVALTAVVVRLGVSLQVAREHGSSDRDRIAINAAAAQGDPLDAALVLATLADAPEQPGFLQTALALAAHPFPAAVLDSGRAINAAAVSPDGDSVAVAEQDGVVRLLAHDAAGDGRIVGRHAKDAIDVEFSPDGRRLVSAGDGGWVIVWGPGPHDAVRLRHRYASGDSMHVSAATFDPSGHNEIVTASGDGVTRFWRPGHGVNSPLAVDDTLDSNQFLARAVFDPHGTRLVTTAATGIIRVWNVVRGRHAAHDAPMFQLDLHPPDNMPTVAAALIGDGRVLGASGTHVLAWHLPGTPMAGQPADSIGTHTGTVQAVAVAPDGRTAASVGDDSSARIWRIAHGDALAGNPVLELAHPARVRTVRFASHGRWLVTTAVDRRVRLWDTERQGVVPLLQAPPGDVARLAFDPTGGRVLAASEAGVVRVWTLDGSARPLDLRHHGPVQFAAFAPDGQRIVTADVDSVRVWNAVDSGAPARTLAAIPPDLRDLTYSRDGARVVAVRGDGALVVWSADGLDPPGPPHATAPAVPAGAASPDGRSVVTAEGATVRVWDAGVATPRRVLSGHHDAVLSAVFAPDGRHIASTGADRTAIVWDVATGDSVVLRGHTDKVRSAVFSPDGRSVATIADDGTVRVWNVNGTGTPLVTPRTNVPLTAVAFSPDGAHVAAAGGSGLVRIWPITWTALMAAVRAAVPGCLGVQARQTLLAMAPEEASDAYAACVAAHGRQHASR